MDRCRSVWCVHDWWDDWVDTDLRLFWITKKKIKQWVYRKHFFFFIFKREYLNNFVEDHHFYVVNCYTRIQILCFCMSPDVLRGGWEWNKNRIWFFLQRLTLSIDRLMPPWNNIIHRIKTLSCREKKSFRILSEGLEIYL